MAEIVTFWLDNKSAAGRLTAQHGDQLLVSYRERYFIVMNGVAVMKGGRPLRYSQTSLPRSWKNLLAGTGSGGEIGASAPDLPDRPPVSKKTRLQKKPEVSVMPEAIPAEQTPHTPPSVTKLAGEKPPKVARKTDGKQTGQTAVAADCPYCSQKHDIPVEKGRSGKPFFLVCTRCQSDFAVRLVQVTIYQAQVAGFR